MPVIVDTAKLSVIEATTMARTMQDGMRQQLRNGMPFLLGEQRVCHDRVTAEWSISGTEQREHFVRAGLFATTCYVI